VTPVSTETASVAPTGTTTSVSSGQAVVVSDSSAGPAVIEAPETGTFEVASVTQGADVVIDGPGTAEVEIGTAVDADGNSLSGSGTSFQIADDYQGSAIVNLNGAITGGTTVDTSTEAVGGGTIASNLPGGDSNAFATPANIDYYINTGAANDQVEGSAGNDFIRLGAGDDAFNAGAGDDIVRMGTGNDAGTLGAGDDIVYLTVDQLQGVNAKAITDFDANGNDKIQIDAKLEDLVDIEGVGTNAIKITLSGAQTGTTTILSEGESIDDDDIEFV
jgi:hypothetical protein